MECIKTDPTLSLRALTTYFVILSKRFVPLVPRFVMCKRKEGKKEGKEGGKEGTKVFSHTKKKSIFTRKC